MSFKMHYTSDYLFFNSILFFIMIFFFHVGPAWYFHYFTHFPLNLHYKGKKKRKNVE
jgi:uncharacterized membrane protein AbrB (regulator of aidB expression)